MGMLLTASGSMLLAASGCGSVKHSENANLIVGKQQFVAKCGACHPLARANTKGTVGPDLDEAFRHGVAEGLGRSTIPSVVQYQVAIPPPQPRKRDAQRSREWLGVEGHRRLRLAYAAVDRTRQRHRPARQCRRPCGLRQTGGREGRQTRTGSQPCRAARLHHQQGRGERRVGDDRRNEEHVRGLDTTSRSRQAHEATPGGPVPVGAGPLEPNGTASFTVNLKPGTYTFFCQAPGHRARRGMVGTLTVK